jgi:hypothetical protein
VKPAAFLTRTGGLIAATGAQKLAYFALQLAFGRIGGLPFLGALAAMNAVLAVVSSSVHAGLPDWVMYTMAAPRTDERAPGRGHGLFLALAVPCYLGLALATPWLVDVPELRGPMLLIVAGSFGNYLVCFSFSGLRGAGRPGLEILTVLVTSAITVAAALLAREVATIAWALLAVGAVNALAVLAASALVAELWPRLPDLSGLWPQVQKSLPYLVIGTGSLWLGTADILLVRWHGDSAAVGLLQSGTLLLRAGLFGPWFAGTLLIKPMLEARRASGKTPLGLLLAIAAVLAAGALTVSRVATPYTFGPLQVDASAALPVLHRSLPLWTVAYFTILLMPVAIAASRRTMLVGVLAALAVCFVPGLFVSSMVAAQALQAAGYAVLFCAAVVSVRRAR